MAEPASGTGSRAHTRGQTYQEGAAALSPSRPETEQERVACVQQRWEQIFGEAIGGELFSALREHLSASELEGYARQALGALSGAAPGLISPTAPGDGGVAISEEEAEAAQKIAAALAEEIERLAVEWLETDSGRRSTAALARWMEDHPVATALSLGMAAISAAVAAYLSNMKIPELKHTFGGGEGFSAQVRARLGRLQQVALQAVTATVHYQAGSLKASLGATYEREDERVGILAGLSDERTLAGGQVLTTTGQLAMYDDGTASVTLDGGLRSTVAETPLALGLGLEHSEGAADASTRMTGSLRLGDEGHYREVTGAWDPTSDRFSLTTTEALVLGSTTYRRTAGVAMDGQGSVSQSVSHQTDDGLRTELDLELREGLATLGIGGSFERPDGWHGSARLGVGLTSERLEDLRLRLGWRDPEAFKGFYVDYRRDWIDRQGVHSDSFDAAFEYAIGRVSTRLSAGVDMEGSQLQGTRAELLAGYSLNPDWMLLGGVSYAGQRTSDSGLFQSGETTLKTGIQYKKVALTVGYRPDDESWSLGISIPLGR